MAELIPERHTCVARMTSGERRLAERLEQKLDDGYLLWYDIPLGPKQRRPDFIVLHPRRGLLVLEVKDHKVDHLRELSKDTWVFWDKDTGNTKAMQSPFEQARGYALDAVKLLQKDSQLTHAEGSQKGKLSFPWSYGVVLSNITRKQFEKAGLDQVLEPDRVLCQDEMGEDVAPETLQSQLWDMFPFARYTELSLDQVNRVRGILFPQVRVNAQLSLLPESDEPLSDDEVPEVPDFMQVMDLQQEQLARSLGDGHRVIHGVAGSGKTMILGFRAEHLARQFPEGKPILVLCFNRPLSQKLAETMRSKGLDGRVHCRTFHSWCAEQLRQHGHALPPTELALKDRFADEVLRVQHGIATGIIPSGQYMSVLIDEAHDFEPDWLRVAVSQVSPSTKSLLVLYDDAQSIYQKRRKSFSFKSVGIEAIGRGKATILRINYRNTRQILQCASRMAQDLLMPQSSDEDGIPTLSPLSSGRDGLPPVFIDKPTLREQAEAIAHMLLQCQQEGLNWSDMAVLSHNAGDLHAIETACKTLRIPVNEKNAFFVGKSRVNLLSMKTSKGLEFPVIALLGGVATQAETEEEASETRRLHYVAATRATHRLIVAQRQATSVEEVTPH